MHAAHYHLQVPMEQTYLTDHILASANTTTPPDSSKLPANPTAFAAAMPVLILATTFLTAFLLGAGLQVLAVPALSTRAGAAPDVHRQ